MKMYRKRGCKVNLRGQFHAATDFTPGEKELSMLHRLERRSGHSGGEERISYHKKTVNAMIYMLLNVVMCFQVTNKPDAQMCCKISLSCLAAFADTNTA
jgi:hypothetical protein